MNFLKDAKGKTSHTRVLVVLCVPLLVLVPLFVSAWLAITKGAGMAIDPSVPLYIATANGIILGYAVHNKREETKIAAAAPGGVS
jgi:hypothetical protein